MIHIIYLSKYLRKLMFSLTSIVFLKLYKFHKFLHCFNIKIIIGDINLNSDNEGFEKKN